MVPNLKKILTAGLAATLSLTMLAGCQNATQKGDTVTLPKLDPGNPVSIEIWHYYNGPQKTAFDNLIHEFNETVGMEQGIIVEAFSQGNVDGLIGQVTEAAEKKVGAPELPDIFAAYADTAYEVDRLGLLADLSPYLSKEELEEYRPEFIEEGYLSGDSSLKIFPIAKSMELFMLNQTDWQTFADATGADLNELSTMEGVTRTAAAYYQWTDSLTPEAGDGKAFFGRDAMANYFIIGCRQLGAEIFSVKDGAVTVNADKDVMRRLWDNYYVPFIHGWFSANGRFRSDAAHTGDIIALVGASSGTTYFPTEVTFNDLESYPIDCLILPAPIFEGGGAYAIQQGAGMSVIHSDATTEYACTVFLKWFTETKRNTEFSVSSGYLPVKQEALNLENLRSAISGEESTKDAARMDNTFSAALEQLDRCTLYTTSAFPGGNAARAVLETSMSTRAAEDRKAILALVAAGSTEAEAMEVYDTEASFDQWYTGFLAELDAACQGG